ncbi:HPr kinase/phosphorylase [Amphiplicatus metriothermophilus]|uniref:Hpr(Ser) kinase/phosphatase n=1 Tax=Amphiplicatus metriothermophilus TaxID=1519374 RepID=A0A239PJW6_9PROT|nr:hypothetical protein [Amphiplicatus metriothermophilus]MBB5518043.1 HPr kinase/phosphorylase [Amphiplicatus metriothermophilus]SNT67623.1 Hpr(Ser) kinase/phosphatase [Amphiplicatus metriothermophilus]
MLIHGVALAVALDPDGPLAGALLLGRSGAGKSALAIAAVETCPWRRTALVADDAAIIESDGTGVWASAPERIRGLVELRGFGPVPIRAAARARLQAVFDLDAPGARVPEPGAFDAGGGVLPRYPFAPGPDGPIRLRMALRAILGGQTP